MYQTTFSKNHLYSTVKGLQLLAKYLSSNFVNGVNNSLLLNEGLEFSQYRAYQPGDDTNKIDWKVFGRSDKLYVRESQKESQTIVHFVLDASNSMNQIENDVSKFNFSKAVIATLAYLADQQNDALQLSIVNDKILSRPFKTLDSLYHLLAKQEAQNRWDPQNLSFSSKKKTLYIYLTDFYESDAEIEKSILSNVHKNSELIVFHLVSNNELNFNYSKNTSFEDLETGEIINVNTSQIKEHFIEKLETKINDLKSKFHSKKIQYKVLNLDFKINQQIKLFLQQRKKLNQT